MLFVTETDLLLPLILTGTYLSYTVNLWQILTSDMIIFQKRLGWVCTLETEVSSRVECRTLMIQVEVIDDGQELTINLPQHDPGEWRICSYPCPTCHQFHFILRTHGWGSSLRLQLHSSGPSGPCSPLRPRASWGAVVIAWWTSRRNIHLPTCLYINLLVSLIL